MAYDKPFSHFDARLKKKLTASVKRATSVKCANGNAAYNLREEFYGLRAAAKHEQKPQYDKWKTLRFKIMGAMLYIHNETETDRLAVLGAK